MVDGGWSPMPCPAWPLPVFSCRAWTLAVFCLDAGRTAVNSENHSFGPFSFGFHAITFTLDRGHPHKTTCELIAEQLSTLVGVLHNLFTNS